MEIILSFHFDVPAEQIEVQTIPPKSLEHLYLSNGVHLNLDYFGRLYNASGNQPTLKTNFLKNYRHIGKNLAEARRLLRISYGRRWAALKQTVEVLSCELLDYWRFYRLLYPKL